MRHPVFPVSAAIAILVSAGLSALAQDRVTDLPDFVKSGKKEVFIPTKGITRVPDNNDFSNPDSEYSFKRCKATDNFVLFWAKEYGDDPMTNATANRRFEVDAILKESDRFYNYYVDTMKWVDKDKSYATKYKFLFFVIGGSGGTAFGGSVNRNIGAFWTPATRINRGPYGVVAHELGHSFQALDGADGAARFSGGNFGEMTSQWMLFQVYPEWQTFENYHLNDFMKRTHLAFMDSDNQYHTCYPLEYWSEKHGVEIIGKMWREVKSGEDPVMTYKRLTGINQEQFNDEMFDACRKFVTWDMPRIRDVAAKYANQHVTSLIRVPESNWFQISPTNCPQNYGYNAIKLQVPAANTKVTIDFKGIAGAHDFSEVHLEQAGWRYGFLAYKEDGSRVYSDTFSKSLGISEFTVPGDTKYLWLVVMGAPTEHFFHVGRRGGGGGGGNRRGGRGGATTNTVANTTNATDATTNSNTNTMVVASASRGAGANPSEQWPYIFRLTGTSPDESIVH